MLFIAKCMTIELVVMVTQENIEKVIGDKEGYLCIFCINIWPYESALATYMQSMSKTT